MHVEDTIGDEKLPEGNMVDGRTHCNAAAYLCDEPPLLITLNLSQVWIGSSVHYHLIQHLVLLALYGLTIPEDLTEQPHPQCDVHSTHLHSASQPMSCLDPAGDALTCSQYIQLHGGALADVLCMMSAENPLLVICSDVLCLMPRHKNPLVLILDGIDSRSSSRISATA